MDTTLQLPRASFQMIITIPMMFSHNFPRMLVHLPALMQLIQLSGYFIVMGNADVSNESIVKNWIELNHINNGRNRNDNSNLEYQSRCSTHDSNMDYDVGVSDEIKNGDEGSIGEKPHINVVNSTEFSDTDTKNQSNKREDWGNRSDDGSYRRFQLEDID
jgi:hypothetical protein